jgi:Transposase
LHLAIGPCRAPLSAVDKPKSSLPLSVCDVPFVKTLTKWLDEISNYLVKRETSGFVEGLNNKIKVIKRRCYGILNKEHLFQRLSLDGTD